MKNKTLKIGLDARMFSDAFTGIGRYNFELTKRLFQQTEMNGRPLEWVIFLNDPQYSQFEFPSHVKKVCVNAGHYSFAEQVKFMWLLYKERCDLVHFTHFNLPLLYNKKFVVTIHDTTISFYPGKKMNTWYRKLGYQMVIRHAVRASKHIITVSQHTKDDVLELFNAMNEKISPIWIAPSSEFVPSSEKVQLAIKKKLGLAEEFLLYTGNWREHKNLDGLIKAFAKVRASHPNLQLVITGKADPNYPEVKEAIDGLNLAEAIKLVGLVDFDELVALFGAAKLYACPSFYEGFGLPPLEAMACGTPTVVAGAASLPEVCAEAAAYFNPHSVESMAEVINELLADPQELERLSALGLQHVLQFSWDGCARQTLEVYETAL